MHIKTMEGVATIRWTPGLPTSTGNRRINMNAHQHHGSSALSESASPKDLKDPVCGMTVTAQSGHMLTHEGRTFYFCSAKCQGKFAANPLQYLAPEPPAETTLAVAGAI